MLNQMASCGHLLLLISLTGGLCAASALAAAPAHLVATNASRQALGPRSSGGGGGGGTANATAKGAERDKEEEEEEEWPAVSYEIEWISQPVDHFGVGPMANRDTFKQRFLVNSQFWCGISCPILFYCGSAGDIEHLANITGWMWQNGATLRALIVFAEHRYYGSSLVYPIDLANLELAAEEFKKLSYLSSAQALEDFHLLVRQIKRKFAGTTGGGGGGGSPVVIAVGGSYGAMLAAWMRLKYPREIEGALAASAPILVGSSNYDNSSYCKIITKSYASYSQNCPRSIKRSWKALRGYARYGADGLKELSSVFKLCDQLENMEDLIIYLKRVWISLAHRDHAHTHIFSKTLPAYPVKRVCSILNKELLFLRDEQLIENIALAAQVYRNHSGQISCLDLNNDGRATTTNSSSSSKLSGIHNLRQFSNSKTTLWNYQVCTEFERPIYSDGENDMFELEALSLGGGGEFCQKFLGGKTGNKTRRTERTATLNENFLRNLNSASNIIFSFGSRNPWSAGCPQKGAKESSIHVIAIDGACDYEDLFASWKNDSSPVKRAREMELRIIKSWIREYNLRERATNQTGGATNKTTPLLVE